MIRKTSPFIKKVGEELIEFLFTNIAKNIELEGGENGETVQSFIDSLREKLKNFEKSLGEKLPKTDIVDNLESEDTEKALSAAQGKALKGLMKDVKTSVYHTDFDTDSEEFAEFMKEVPDGGLITLPENALLRDITVKDLNSLSLYNYNYSPIERDSE